MKITLAAVLTLAAVAAVTATAQQPQPVEAQKPKPAEQSVVAPSLPDEPNKEGKVRPDGSIRTDEYGNILQVPGVVDPSVTPNAGPPPGVPAPPGSAPAVPAQPALYPAVPTPPPGPAGPAVVGATYLSVTGTVKAYDKGVSITIVQKNGRERIVKIVPKATVYDGLAVGDKVVLKIPLKRPADGKSADKIMKWLPPKAPPKSNFSAQESPIAR